MPFKNEDCKTLRDRLSLSQYKFAKQICEWAEVVGLVEKCTLTPQTINNVEHGKKISMDTLDYLAGYAVFTRNADLKFYYPPTE